MKKVDKILKQLSDLYEFNRRIKGYKLKKKESADERWERGLADRRTPQPGAGHEK
jgi:hypothetical protein